MDREAFKEYVSGHIKEYLPPEYQDYRVESRTFLNGEGIALIHPTRPGASPILYADRLYRDYRGAGDIEKTMQRAAAWVVRYYPAGNLLARSLDWDHAGENITAQLINTEQRAALLGTVPHREVMDLSVIYRWQIGYTDGNEVSVIITHELAERLGMAEERLFAAAKENTRRIFPASIRPIGSVLQEYFPAMPEELPEGVSMLILGNRQGMRGAVSALYDDVLRRAAGLLGGDLYLLPSSIHEMIAVPAAGDPSGLIGIVREINRTEVEPKDRLADNVYHYDKTAHVLTVAGGTNPEPVAVWKLDGTGRKPEAKQEIRRNGPKL